MYLYQEGKTIFHSLHPLTKLLLLFLLISVPFLLHDFLSTLLLLLVNAVLLLTAHGKRNLLRFSKLLVLFWAFTFLIWIIVPELRLVAEEQGVRVYRV